MTSWIATSDVPNPIRSWPSLKRASPPHHDRHRERRPLASRAEAALGRAIQLLCPGLPLGTNVRTGVPLFSLLRSRLSQSALLAGPAHAGAWHPLSAVRERFLAVFRS